jgi:hypothetical protein
MFIEKLKNWNACSDALIWLGDRTEAEALRDCERGDWLLWWLWRERNNEGYADIRALTKAKSECARLVQHLMKDPRSIAALDACDQYYEGMISDEQLAAAAAAAYPAYPDAYPAYAAAAAAAAAADAAYAAAADAAAADAAYAAAADAAAADAAYAADADADAAAADARLDTLKKCADICRIYLFVPEKT